MKMSNQNALRVPPLHVATCGLVAQEWPSLNRTLAFVRGALNTPDINSTAHEEATAPPDVLLNFSGNAGWDVLSRARAYPAVFFMHGGCVLNRPFIRRQLPQLRQGDTLIVQSSADQAILDSMVEPSFPFVKRLPIPVDIDLFKPQGRAAARAELGLDGDTFCIGIVARLLPQKNIHGALEVVGELVRNHPGRKLKVVIIGTFWKSYRILRFDETPYAQLLRRLIEREGLTDLVTYLPAQLSDQELARAYRAFDALLHTTNSIDENYGLAPIEAMASGVPVVGCAYGGLKDTILDGETGFLCATWLSFGGIREDRGELVNGLRRLLTDEALRERMGKAARQRAVDYYSVQPCSKVLRGILSSAYNDWRGATSPQCALKLAVEPNVERYDSHLTAIHDRLSYYAASLLHYVSRVTPRISEVETVQHFANLEPDGDGMRAANPAWPARYRLLADQLKALRASQGGAAAQALAADHGQPLVDDLLAIGVLVARRGAT